MKTKQKQTQKLEEIKMKKSTNGLKILLASHNMKQGELATELGVSQGLVSQWATGRIDIPKKMQEKIVVIFKEKNEIVKAEKRIAQKSTEVKGMKEIISMALEDKIGDCKKYCLETYGFEIVVMK